MQYNGLLYSCSVFTGFSSYMFVGRRPSRVCRLAGIYNRLLAAVLMANFFFKFQFFGFLNPLVIRVSGGHDFVEKSMCRESS